MQAPKRRPTKDRGPEDDCAYESKIESFEKVIWGREHPEYFEDGDDSRALFSKKIAWDDYDDESFP